MKPMDDQSLITDLTMLRPGLIVTDVVYDPEETKLLREAKAAGCKTFDGLGMLVEQGAASFKLYTGPGHARRRSLRTQYTDKESEEKEMSMKKYYPHSLCAVHDLLCPRRRQLHHEPLQAGARRPLGQLPAGRRHL